MGKITPFCSVEAISSFFSLNICSKCSGNLHCFFLLFGENCANFSCF